jgi:hypothetical protein
VPGRGTQYGIVSSEYEISYSDAAIAFSLVFGLVAIALAFPAARWYRLGLFLSSMRLAGLDVLDDWKADQARRVWGSAWSLLYGMPQSPMAIGRRREQIEETDLQWIALVDGVVVAEFWWQGRRTFRKYVYVLWKTTGAQRTPGDAQRATPEHGGISDIVGSGLMGWDPILVPARHHRGSIRNVEKLKAVLRKMEWFEPA